MIFFFINEKILKMSQIFNYKIIIFFLITKEKNVHLYFPNSKYKMKRSCKLNEKGKKERKKEFCF